MVRGDVERRKSRQGHSRLITNLKLSKAACSCNKRVNTKKICGRRKENIIPQCYTLIQDQRKWVANVKTVTAAKDSLIKNCRMLYSGVV